MTPNKVLQTILRMSGKQLSGFEEILVISSLDGASEPSLLWTPPEPMALVVGLHTWSADRFNQQEAMQPFCAERNWALLLPEFRGPNLADNPRVTQAGGSKLACRDIVDATIAVQKRLGLENKPVFLHGGSGGGHMGLMTAARETFEWTAISSWCPITDLAVWHGQPPFYRPHIAAVCGGAPGPDTEKTYRDRSPINYAEILAQKNLLLAHGRHDASVPYTHSWQLIQKMEAFHPKRFYFHIFDGAHEILHHEAFPFFDRCIRKAEEQKLTG